MSIDDLSVRALTGLRNSGYDLLTLTKAEVVEGLKTGKIDYRKTRNMGIVTFKEIAAWAGVEWGWFCVECPYCGRPLKNHGQTKERPNEDREGNASATSNRQDAAAYGEFQFQ